MIDYSITTFYLVADHKPNYPLVKFIKTLIDDQIKNIAIRDRIKYPFIRYSHTDHFDEILQIIHYIDKLSCQNLIVLILLYNKRYIGLSLVMIDDDLVFGKETSFWGIPFISKNKICYFIGINKFLPDNIDSKNILTNSKLDDLVILEISKLTKQHNCKYIACTPSNKREKELCLKNNFVLVLGRIYYKPDIKFISHVAVQPNEQHYIGIVK